MSLEAKKYDETRPHYRDSNGDLFNEILTPKYDISLSRKTIDWLEETKTRANGIVDNLLKQNVLKHIKNAI